MSYVDSKSVKSIKAVVAQQSWAPWRDVSHGHRMAELSVSGWSCLSHTSICPKPWSLRVTDYDEIKEAMGKTHFFFIAFHQDRGRQVQGPQGRSLPRPPPWDWVEAVKRRGSQAAPVTVTLRVTSQHCDCLIHTYFLILTVPLSWTWAWYVPCRVHTGWETKETWAYALLYVRGNFPICGQSL